MHSFWGKCRKSNLGFTGVIICWTWQKDHCSRWRSTPSPPPSQVWVPWSASCTGNPLSHSCNLKWSSMGFWRWCSLTLNWRNWNHLVTYTSHCSKTVSLPSSGNCQGCSWSCCFPCFLKCASLFLLHEFHLCFSMDVVYFGLLSAFLLC
jgi:hypothetical protein